MGLIELPEGVPAEWRPLIGDPHAWDLLEPLSLTDYLLRCNSEGWQLIKVFAQIGGSSGPEAQLKEWARLAVKRRANCSIIDWLPSPGAHPGYTTLYGSGAPRVSGV